MITGTFEMPDNLTPELARELIDIAMHFKPLNRDALRNTIHRALCQLLVKVSHFISSFNKFSSALLNKLWKN